MHSHILPTEEAQPFDGLSDRDFFARFPTVTHRIVPWAPCLATEEWMVVSRRDGLRMRARRNPAAPMGLEFITLAQPPADSILSFDHGPSLNIVGAARHAR